jgi:cysteine desulfurase/selenocysteine lyase
LGSLTLNEGDEILLSQMEHHSNIVPWFMIAKEKKAVVKFVPVLESGQLDVVAFGKLLSRKTKIVSLVHLSNALGTVNPLGELFQEAHKFGAFCIADAAQSVATGDVNVQALNCDFLVFSGHKMFGPTGVGVVYGKGEWLDKLPPYQGGGSMIAEVTESGFTVLPPPHRFEAGTPPIAEVIGLGAAVDFVQNLGSSWIKDHERRLMALAELELSGIEGLRRVGGAPGSQHVFSFLLEKAHASDVGAILDEQGIAVRAGHHCCQPLMRKFGISGTVRASFAVYTSEDDIFELAKGLRKAGELLT